MKKLTGIVLLGMLLSLQGMFAQTCDHRKLIGADGGPSVLDVILGDYPRLGEKALQTERGAVKGGIWTKWFPEGVIDHQLGNEVSFGHNMMVTTKQFTDEEISQSGYWNGILRMLTGDYGQAVEEFNLSENKAFLGRTCRLNEYRLIASYLSKYGDETPLFPHFNGGFFNFCQDSLRWGREVYDTEVYQRVVESVVDMIILSNEEPVYFELLGDLLSQNSDQVTANWFGCSAYLRAMHLVPDFQTEFEEKALFALESPVMVRRRFDNYQFTQFKKHFQHDLDAAKEVRTSYLASETASASEARVLLAKTYTAPTADFRYFDDTDEGKVAGVLVKAVKREAEKSGVVGKFAGDAELDKEVKTDTTFNAYAIVMILVVIFAVVFIGLQVRRNRKNMA